MRNLWVVEHKSHFGKGWQPTVKAFLSRALARERAKELREWHPKCHRVRRYVKATF